MWANQKPAPLLDFRALNVVKSLIAMSHRGKIACGLVAGALVVVLLSLLGRAPVLPPPGVTILGAEPVDLIDDEGTELQLVSLRISNTCTQWPPQDPRNVLHVLIREQALRVKQGGEWRSAQYATNIQHLSLILYPDRPVETTLLAPSHAREGRLRLHLAGPSAGVLLHYRIWRWLEPWLPRRLLGVVAFILPQLAREPYHRFPMIESEWDVELTSGSDGRPRVDKAKAP
jgi:hypothetical protein